MLLTTQCVKTKTYVENRIDKAAAVLWNDLPTDIRNIHFVNVLKKNLKAHLLDKLFIVYIIFLYYCKSLSI